MPRDETEYEAFQEKFGSVADNYEMRHVFRDGKLVLMIGRWCGREYDSHFHTMWSTDIDLLELKEALRTAEP